MNNINDLIFKYQEMIKACNKDESVIFSLIEYITKLDKSQLLLATSINIDENLLSKYVSEYCNGKSLQYITNTSYFLSREFYVDNRVLIPRFETEEVVLKALEIIKEHNIKSVFEVGSGSGVIAISINLDGNVDVDSVDISEDALQVAKFNNEKHNASVNFYKGDLLFGVEDKYEMIISNPPYIPTSGYVASETLQNEPHLALFGGSDGLDFYRQIISQAKVLTKLKFIVFEIGFDQGEAIKALANDVSIFKDINGNDRIAVICIRS